MPALVDTTVWFPIPLQRREHHGVAWRWWEAQATGAAVWRRVAAN